MATSPSNSEQQSWDDDRVARFIESYHERLLAADDARNGSPEATATPASELDDSTLESLEAAGQVLRTLVRARAIAPDARPGSPSEERGKVSIWEVLSRSDGADQSLRQLGRFSIVRELGRGGFAVVFLAVDPVLNRQVALKVPRPEVLLSEGVHLRFDREAQAVARLTHPNLIPLFEVGSTGAITYIVSAYCAGPSLAQYLQEQGGRLEQREAARLVEQLAGAAHYAHTQGVLHRDIKPGNVLLEPAATSATGPLTAEDTDVLPYVPKLVDFGLARLEGGDRDQSRTGVALGTPGYMAPEQAEGRAAAMGPATDVYGLGALLYEALTGNKPFASSSEAETLRRVLLDDPPRPRATLRTLSRDLEAICLRCLEKRPGDRYASARELADDLHRFLAGEATHARPLGVLARAGRWARRRPTAAALVGVSCATAVALTLFGVFHTQTLQQSLNREKELVVKLKGMARPGFMRQMQHLLVQGDGDGARRLRDDFDPGVSDVAGRFDADYLATLLARRPTVCVGHEGETYGVTFSPDGQTLYSAGADKTVRMWRTATAEPVATLSGHTAEVNSVCVTHDGRWLFSVDDAGDLRRWDARTGESHGTAARLPRRGWGLTVSRDGSELWCVGNFDQRQAICSWTLGTDGALSDLRNFDGLFDAVQPLGVRQALGVSAQERAISLLRDGEPPTALKSVGHYICSALSANDRALALGDMLGNIAFYDPRKLEVGSTTPDRIIGSAHLGEIESIGFWHDDTVLASASRDGMVRLWDVQTGELLDTLCTDTTRLWSVAVSHDDQWLAAASAQGPILWRLSDPQTRPWNQWSHSNPTELHTAGGLRGDAAAMAIGLADGQVAIFDVWQGRERDRFRAAKVGAAGLIYSADGSRLALELASGEIQLWIMTEGAPRRLAIWQADDAYLSLVPHRHLGFAARAPRALLGPIGGKLLLIDTTVGKTLREIDTPEEDIHQILSPLRRGSFLMSLASKRVVALAAENLAELSSMRTIHDHYMIGCSPDGDIVAVLNGQALMLWSMSTSQAVASLAFDAVVASFAFSPNSDLLAVSLADGSIRLVDLPTRQETLRLPGLGGSRTLLAFSADGRALVNARLEPEWIQVRTWRIAN